MNVGENQQVTEISEPKGPLGVIVQRYQDLSQ